jgi:predicted nucleic acid-binding protein
MAVVIADASFLVALLSDRDGDHEWALQAGRKYPPPWHTCDAALSEAFHLLASRGVPVLGELLRRRVLESSFAVGADLERVLALMERYAEIPMSLADACLVRMTETSSEPMLLTTDSDFRVYRRNGRQVIPCALPD